VDYSLEWIGNLGYILPAEKIHLVTSISFACWDQYGMLVVGFLDPRLYGKWKCLCHQLDQL